MIVEIKGTGNQNKGAEMMLLTILANIGSIGARFAYAPLLSSDQYPFYSSLGLYPKVWLRYKGIQLGRFASIIPKKLRDMYGLVLDKEIDAILDASGFAYSDQWGDGPTKVMAAEVRRWRSKGKKIILLPQAFGPFNGKIIRKDMRNIIEGSDLIYARDQQSYQDLLDIHNYGNIKLCPDFTVLFEGVLPHYYDKSLKTVCIVPNNRVMDKGRGGMQYINLISNAIEYFQDTEFTPIFLIHGGLEDEKLAGKINSTLKRSIEIISESNPAYIKGIISASVGLVGSRYHAIASALYTGIVSIGIGWSHKYECLFQDMGFPNGLISTDIKTEDLYVALDTIAKDSVRFEVERMLLIKSCALKETAKNMFNEVINCLTAK